MTDPSNASARETADPNAEIAHRRHVPAPPLWAPVAQPAQRHAHDEVLVDSRCQLGPVLFDNAAEGVLVTDRDGRILRTNPAFEAITGYAEAEVLGRTPAVLSSGRHDADFYRAMWSALLSRGRWSGELWNRRRDGQAYAEQLRIVAVKDASDAVTHYVGLFTDITAQKTHQASLERLTHYDALTGLPNRALMLDRLRVMMSQADRRQGHLAVCYLDLDDFKEVNDGLGREAGDAVLLAAADRIRATLRAEDTVARLGGDEFVLLLGDAHAADEVRGVVARVLQAIAAPSEFGGRSMAVTTSIGVALYPEHGSTPEHLLRNADQAMYRAKHLGKNQVCLATHGDDFERVLDADRAAVRDALHAGQMRLHFQPQIDARSGAPVGAEALVRWQHPQRGLVPPGDFLPMLEGTDLEIDLDLWVLEHALEQLARWQSQGFDLVMCVNLSAATMAQPDLVEHITRRIERSGAQAAGRLELEVVESAALKHMRRAVHAMESCARLGISFALDDFGTGYSSLAYLRQLPVHVLKIDQGFVRRMLEDASDLHIVKAVVGLASGFNVKTVAEGVESDAQASALAALGCDMLQGYGIGRPMPAGEFTAWFERQRCACPGEGVAPRLAWPAATLPPSGR